MTAIVGILNKQAVAVAADSAVTIGLGQKIYNTANKIFTLSKHHPVGIAIFGTASYNCCVPWEIVVKMYRDQLGNTKKNTIKEYALDFLDYLERYKKKYLTQDDLNKALCRDVFDFWRVMVLNKKPNDLENGFKIEELPDIKKRLSDIQGRCSTGMELDQLKDIKKDVFLGAIHVILDLIAKQYAEVGADFSEDKDILEDIFFSVFTKKVYNIPNYSGLAFFGFGDEEIYPSLYSVRVYNSVVTASHWEDEAFDQVKEPPKDAYICPMAQKDEMFSYITGINPYIEEAVLKTTEATYRLLLDTIANLVAGKDDNLANNIKGIDLDALMEDYQKKIQGLKQTKMISPLMQTVSTMGKEDLAELAENLIYQTSLKRHITPNLESVGGPVDVAVISKGDGFIWIKRKHYFSPDLNRSFFDNYFEHK